MICITINRYTYVGKDRPMGIKSQFSILVVCIFTSCSMMGEVQKFDLQKRSMVTMGVETIGGSKSPFYL